MKVRKIHIVFAAALVAVCAQGFSQTKKCIMADHQGAALGKPVPQWVIAVASGQYDSESLGKLLGYSDARPFVAQARGSTLDEVGAKIPGGVAGEILEAVERMAARDGKSIRFTPASYLHWLNGGSDAEAYCQQFLVQLSFFLQDMFTQRSDFFTEGTGGKVPMPELCKRAFENYVLDEYGERIFLGDFKTWTYWTKTEVSEGGRIVDTYYEYYAVFIVPNRNLEDFARVAGK